MKQILILSVILVASFRLSVAATYEEAMGSNIQKMYSAQTAEELTAIANQFERIGAKETDKWLPGYYSAYSYLMILFKNNSLTADQKNSYLDKAQPILDKLEKDFSGESEVFVLQAMVYQMRITDPSLGYKFSTLANDALAKAEKLNNQNPRVYYLKGCNIFYTPENYGGGAANAKPLLEKAKGLFETQKPANALMPAWGSEHCSALLGQCAGK